MRLGCGLFCQNAGGYGGGPDDSTPKDVTVLVEGRQMVSSDGTVAITLRCEVRTTCRGAIFLMLDASNDAGWSGASDLALDGTRTGTFLIPLVSSALDHLRQVGTATLYVMVDASLTAGCTYHVTAVSACARFEPPPTITADPSAPYGFTIHRLGLDDDGIDTLSGGTVDVSVE
jgi:hypothetical protein